MTLEEFVRQEVEKRGGDPERALLYRDYWERKYKAYLRRLSIAQRSSEEILEWVYQTLFKAETEEELSETIAEIREVLRIYRELQKEVGA